MDQYLSLVTLAVPSLEAVRQFYVHGLGWQPTFDDLDVIFLPVAPGVVLSLWEEASFRAEVGEPVRGLAPLTLAHNVGSDDDVDAVIEAARAAGAREVRPAQRRDWGGYSGYVVDPAGFTWEIAHAPGEAAADAVAVNRAFARRDRTEDGRRRPGSSPGGLVDRRGRPVGPLRRPRPPSRWCRR